MQDRIGPVPQALEFYECHGQNQRLYENLSLSIDERHGGVLDNDSTIMSRVRDETIYVNVLP
jgi:hypothetical protein